MSPSVRSKKALLAWCLFDWANSAFPTLILTFIFAAFFTKKVALNPIVGTAQWGDAVAFSGLLVAIASPIFGAIADREGRRKPWLAIFSILCVIASAMLWYTKPSHTDIQWVLTWVILGIFGLEVGMVFYNAMLSELAPRNYLGRISGWAWSTGYFGGLTALSLMLFVIHINTDEKIRLVGPFVAIWFLIFSWPLFVWTPDRCSTGLPYSKAIKEGLLTLYKTLSAVKCHKEIFKFLVARIFYIDGLNTIFAFGGIYAANTFKMSLVEVIEFGIAMNIAAGLGAATLAWLDDLRGSKSTLLLALIIMIFCGTSMLIVHSKTLFWIYGMGLSFCVGPVQAASRSLLIRLSPQSLITELFGLYALSGKATAFLGPWILALLTEAAKSQRIGMSVTMLFLFLGALLLLFVRTRQ